MIHSLTHKNQFGIKGEEGDTCACVMTGLKRQLVFETDTEAPELKSKSCRGELLAEVNEHIEL